MHVLREGTIGGPHRWVLIPNAAKSGSEDDIPKITNETEQGKVTLSAITGSLAPFWIWRLEEQQKKDAAVVAAAAILSSPSSLSPTKSSYISLPIPHYHHHSHQSSSSIQFSSLPSVDNSLFRPPLLPAQNIDVRKPNNVPFTNQVANNDGFEIPGHANVPKLWNPREYSLEKEISSGLDPGFAHRSTLNLPYEPITVWPLNASIVGMKRPYPFSLDNPPGPPFSIKFPAFVAPMRVDEPASCRNGGSFNLETSNPKLREGPSCSTSILESYSKNSIQENGAFSGDFLTLSLPTWTSQSPKFNLPSGHLSFHNCEIPNFATHPFQGSVNDPKTKFQPEPSVPTEQQRFYSFFPPATPQIGQAETTMHNCHGEVRENVDLNLKL
ncbi:hypothetical protein FEM48_Zijuj12G0110500 [Ziziphus jujuba var. spinosa]|uniref:Uncharacterized protein n=1 Tax=Ziziphus jujuba var. spinosa TaxID=714518 RepID=A0A978UCY0_ZIZJJ|nr:hypothetical protein FEM48_Zijuj12G0110500 [Ziziphus jujuba var. spinosa]